MTVIPLIVLAISGSILFWIFKFYCLIVSWNNKAQKCEIQQNKTLNFCLALFFLYEICDLKLGLCVKYDVVDILKRDLIIYSIVSCLKLSCGLRKSSFCLCYAWRSHLVVVSKRRVCLVTNGSWEEKMRAHCLLSFCASAKRVRFSVLQWNRVNVEN